MNIKRHFVIRDDKGRPCGKQVFSWALYDWANSAFATVVLAGFFPLFFKQYWSTGADPASSTFQLGVANSLASMIIVLLAPVLGAIADSGNAKKKFLGFFALLGIIMTGALYFVEQGNWPVAIVLFVLAGIGFAGANIFYDALIVSIAPKKQLDFISSLGFSLGYLGGGLLFAVNVAMVVWPEVFGFTNSTEAVRVSFISVALWWFVFSIPLFAFVPEPVTGQIFSSSYIVIKAGFRQLKKTFNEIRKLRVVALFLLAYWLYIDGVDTIIRMAVDYGLALGFNDNDLIAALLITQFVGFPSAIVFGLLGQRFGAKRGILFAIGVYLLVVLFATRMDSVSEFYVLAITIGLVQGGVQALSRSFYARIIPANKAAEFFGFYNMLGKFAAVIGPVMMGGVGLITGSPRLSILSLAVLFIGGAVLLYFVNEEQGRRMAHELE